SLMAMVPEREWRTPILMVSSAEAGCPMAPAKRIAPAPINARSRFIEKPHVLVGYIRNQASCVPIGRAAITGCTGTLLFAGAAGRPGIGQGRSPLMAANARGICKCSETGEARPANVQAVALACLRGSSSVMTRKLLR